MPAFAHRPEPARKTQRRWRNQKTAATNSQPTPWRKRPIPAAITDIDPPADGQSTDNFVAGKELRYLDRRRLRGIGTMHRILADRLRVHFADRTLRGLGRIGGAHHVTMPEHGIFAFQNLNDNRTGNHEVHQFAEERTRLVDGIESLGLLAGHANPLLGNDAKTGLFDQRVDRASQIARGRVRLDNRKGALNRHDSFVLAKPKLMGIAALISAPCANGKRPDRSLWRPRTASARRITAISRTLTVPETNVPDSFSFAAIALSQPNVPKSSSGFRNVTGSKRTDGAMGRRTEETTMLRKLSLVAVAAASLAAAALAPT